MHVANACMNAAAAAGGGGAGAWGDAPPCVHGLPHLAAGEAVVAIGGVAHCKHRPLMPLQLVDEIAGQL